MINLPRDRGANVVEENNNNVASKKKPIEDMGETMAVFSRVLGALKSLGNLTGAEERQLKEAERALVILTSVVNNGRLGKMQF